MRYALALVLAAALYVIIRTWRPVKCQACNGRGNIPANFSDGERPCSLCRRDEYDAYRQGIAQEIERQNRGRK